jgi:hypothetical protein
VLAIALAGVAVSGSRTPSGAPASPRTAPTHFSLRVRTRGCLAWSMAARPRCRSR